MSDRMAVNTFVSTLCVIVCLVFFPPELLFFGGLPKASAMPPSIDSLRSLPTAGGTVEYWAGIGYRPAGKQNVVHVGDAVIRVIERQNELVANWGAAYHPTFRLSFWGEGTHVNTTAETFFLSAEHNESSVRTREHRDVVLGVRYRWNPSSPLDPRIGWALLTREGVSRGEFFIASISDPVLLSFRVARTFGLKEEADPSLERMSASGGLGLVLNETMTLLFSAGHSMPVTTKELGTSLFSVKWTWMPNPDGKGMFALWASSSHIGNYATSAFGVEWRSQFSPRTRP